MAEKGKLFVVSAPSGAGKTTLIQKVLSRFENLAYSVSHTTRPPRPGEIDGRDYFFVDEAQFKALIEENQMLEWAKVHNNYYGTSKTAVTGALEQGRNVLLDIDVQGAKQIMASELPLVSIFIMPPSMAVLEQRLRARGTDADEVIAVRLENARAEMAQQDLYTFRVVNDDLETAVSDILGLFEKELGPS